MGLPIISVVMSVFNGQSFLPEAIESILGQTFRDFEFVIIDDGSTDRTAEILAASASRDERIRVVHHENKGRVASLNIGIELARGFYIARMDADDVALPGRLREQVEFMQRHPELGLLGAGIEMINSTGRVLKACHPPAEDSEIRTMMLRHNAFFHPTVLMKKEVVLASGGYRKALLDADDYDLWLRIAERCQLANLSACLLQYRVHVNQVSVRNLKHQAICGLAARAAASSRKSGGADPLTAVEEITPQLLDDLGVTNSQINETVGGLFEFWMPIVGDGDPETSLRIIDGLLELSGLGFVDRATVANALLIAAKLHYGQGRVGKAAVLAGRAVLARPMVAGRPVKRAFARCAAAMWDKPR